MNSRSASGNVSMLVPSVDNKIIKPRVQVCQAWDRSTESSLNTSCATTIVRLDEETCGDDDDDDEGTDERKISTDGETICAFEVCVILWTCTIVEAIYTIVSISMNDQEDYHSVLVIILLCWSVYALYSQHSQIVSTGVKLQVCSSFCFITISIPALLLYKHPLQAAPLQFSLLHALTYLKSPLYVHVSCLFISLVSWPFVMSREALPAFLYIVGHQLRLSACVALDVNSNSKGGLYSSESVTETESINESRDVLYPCKEAKSPRKSHLRLPKVGSPGKQQQRLSNTSFSSFIANVSRDNGGGKTFTFQGSALNCDTSPLESPISIRSSYSASESFRRSPINDLLIRNLSPELCNNLLLLFTRIGAELDPEVIFDIVHKEMTTLIGSKVRLVQTTCNDSQENCNQTRIRLPIHDANYVLQGFVETFRDEEISLTEVEKSVLGIAGWQGLRTIENASLLCEMKAHRILLAATSEICDAQLEMSDMMHQLMTKARSVLTTERATVYLLDHDRNELWSTLIDSQTAMELGKKVCESIIRTPVGVGLAGQVAKTGQVLNVGDCQKCDLFNNSWDKLTGFETKNTLCVPIRSSTRILGVLQFINKVNGNTFTQKDEQLAMSFSRIAAVGMQNILFVEEQNDNKELTKKTEAAQQADEAKSNFLMAMSHEIRTPLGGVIGMTELLSRTKLSDEQVELTSIINNCAEALMTIINDVLDIGKIEAGKLDLEKIKFELPKVVEDACTVLSSKAVEKNISIVVDISPDVCISLAGDPYRLHQIILNLVSNAVKFTPKGGTVTVAITVLETSSKKQILRADVFDTGIGISQEKIKTLFQPFVQEDTGTTRQYGGSGLGLSICKHLTSLMNGEIWVTSSKGHGSVFSFTAEFWLLEENQNWTLRQELLRLRGVSPRNSYLAISNPRQLSVLKAIFEIGGCFVKIVKSRSQLLSILESDEDCSILIDDWFDNISYLDFESASDTTLSNCCVIAPVRSEWRNIVSHTISCPVRVSSVWNFIHDTAFKTASRPSSCGMSSKNSSFPLHYNILVAEDNITNQKLITKQLECYGIFPTICCNGRMAVEKIKEEYHPIILMDCHMPVMDGYDATREIRSLEKNGHFNHPPIVIVALTADALPNTRESCIAAGMDDYMTKPFRRRTLSSFLSKYAHLLSGDSSVPLTRQYGSFKSLKSQ